MEDTTETEARRQDASDSTQEQPQMPVEEQQDYMKLALQMRPDRVKDLIEDEQTQVQQNEDDDPFEAGLKQGGTADTHTAAAAATDSQEDQLQQQKQDDYAFDEHLQDTPRYSENSVSDSSEDVYVRRKKSQAKKTPHPLEDGEAPAIGSKTGLRMVNTVLSAPSDKLMQKETQQEQEHLQPKVNDADPMEGGNEVEGAVTDTEELGKTMADPVCRCNRPTPHRHSKKPKRKRLRSGSEAISGEELDAMQQISRETQRILHDSKIPSEIQPFDHQQLQDLLDSIRMKAHQAGVNVLSTPPVQVLSATRKPQLILDSDRNLWQWSIQKSEFVPKTASSSAPIVRTTAASSSSCAAAAADPGSRSALPQLQMPSLSAFEEIELGASDDESNVVAAAPRPSRRQRLGNGSCTTSVSASAAATAAPVTRSTVGLYQDISGRGKRHSMLRELKLQSADRAEKRVREEQLQLMKEREYYAQQQRQQQQRHQQKQQQKQQQQEIASDEEYMLMDDGERTDVEDDSDEERAEGVHETQALDDEELIEETPSPSLGLLLPDQEAVLSASVEVVSGAPEGSKAVDKAATAASAPDGRKRLRKFADSSSASNQEEEAATAAREAQHKELVDAEAEEDGNSNPSDSGDDGDDTLRGVSQLIDDSVALSEDASKSAALHRKFMDDADSANVHLAKENLKVLLNVDEDQEEDETEVNGLKSRPRLRADTEPDDVYDSIDLSAYKTRKKRVPTRDLKRLLAAERKAREKADSLHVIDNAEELDKEQARRFEERLRRDESRILKRQGSSLSRSGSIIHTDTSRKTLERFQHDSKPVSGNGGESRMSGARLHRKMSRHNSFLEHSPSQVAQLMKRSRSNANQNSSKRSFVFGREKKGSEGGAAVAENGAKVKGGGKGAPSARALAMLAAGAAEAPAAPAIAARSLKRSNSLMQLFNKRKCKQPRQEA